MKSTKTYIAIVDILKACACIMIFLTHCNTILPGEWKFLTVFGQDLGNNLFFMVSGFSLAPSIIRTEWRDAPAWYVKRLVRILPITIIVYIIMFFMGYYSFADPSQVFVVFVYPTLYWFIEAILVFYIVLFVLAKLTDVRTQAVICIALAVIYILLTGRHERFYFIGLLSMIAGYMVRTALDNKTDIKLKRYMPIGILVSLIVFLIAERFDGAYAATAVILLSAEAVGVLSLITGYLVNDRISTALSDRAMLHGVIKHIGNMALPLYLVQSFCSGYIGFWIGLHIDFPLSFLVNFIVSWGLGTVLYFISKACTLLYGKITV